ncbi:MAG: glycine/sarcosine/betaine reductase component B subunit [Synergistes sp.]|nr:glycine/sarcosine/betaine reductase component B subunit [Synergistes sp.]
MKLELERAKVKNIVWGETTALLPDGTLRICKEDLLEAAADRVCFKSIGAELARPGESVRICPVKDVIEPRCKTEGQGQVFPGMLSGVETVGSGKTFVLSGAAVVTCGRIVGFQEGIIDMQGTGADYTPFSKTMNAVLVIEPNDGIEPHEYEKACRMAGLRAAYFIASSVWKAGASVSETEVYELPSFTESAKSFPDLPKVVYIYMLQTQGLLHDTYVYGVDAKKMLPTFIHPNETMDGAVISGNCVSACDKNSTYIHLNNPVIKSLYEHHGKDLNFVGVIITNENVTLADKQRSSSYTAKLAAMLGADGAVVSEEGFGNPDADLILNCRKLEKCGIKTTLITDEYAGRDGASQSLADASPLADAVVTAGNANMIVRLPKQDRLIGFDDYIDVLSGGFDGSLHEDGSIEVELQAITGATCELGFGKLGGRTW